jgi:hypothetical protein
MKNPAVRNLSLAEHSLEGPFPDPDPVLFVRRKEPHS